MHGKLAVVAVVSMALCLAEAHNFTDCGARNKTERAIVPESVYFSPDPPMKGEKWAVGFTARPLRPILNGTLTVTVSIWNFPISHSLDICKGGDGWPGCPFDGPINITDWNPVSTLLPVAETV